VDYLDFRLTVTPDVATVGNWQIQVDDCPLPELVGNKGSVAPAVTREQLNTLRSREGWPNVNKLQTIGGAVWQSVMTESARAAFFASLAVAKAQKRGLRLVFVLQGDDRRDAGAGTAIRLPELPLEALFSEQFFATDLMTPVSRSLQMRPDQDPFRLKHPLRVLVAVAAPNDRPPADAAKELTEIENAVAALAGAGGRLELDVLEQATREAVQSQLVKKPYHVLHFIGHGGFDVVGDDATPSAYVCFVRDDGSGKSDPTDALTVSEMLRNTTVRLVVITACSSAAPTPPQPGDPIDAGPLGTAAFDGMAQRLVSGVSPVSAAIGMQFDLESSGAVAFSRSFYENLLEPGIALDEIVTRARKALVGELNPGHRAWVTPTVYWRCKNGLVFDIELSEGELPDDVLAKIHDIDLQLGFHRGQIEKIASKTAEERAALAGFKSDAIADIEKLVADRAELLGETIRLTWDRAAAGPNLRCRLSLRMRQAGVVESVSCTAEFPPGSLSYVGAEAGDGLPGPPLTAAQGGAVQVRVEPGGVEQWPIGERDLGFLTFAPVAGAALPPVLDIALAGPNVVRDGQPARFRTADAVVVAPDA
jgi:hypothetical protein